MKQKRTPKIEIYKDEKDEWRWRYKAANHKIVAQGEGYKRKESVYKALASMKFDFPDAEIETIE